MTLRLVRGTGGNPDDARRHNIRSDKTQRWLDAGENISGGGAARVALLHTAQLEGPSTALDPAEIQALFRLLRLIEPALARRSIDWLHPEAIGRLERTADLITSNRLRPREAVGLYNFLYGGLVVPGASHVETVIVMPLLQRVTAHFEAHYRRLGVHPYELGEGDDSNHRLIDAFRTGDPDAAEDGIRDHLNGCEQFALWIRTLA